MSATAKSKVLSEFSEDQLKTLALSVGLNEGEWTHFVTTLGRLPSPVEIQMIGVMWSEHCSYKSSKHELKKLITQSSAVLQGPGENAGLVRLDEKRAIAFKVESHNHPSFVEPFQGAATGVGGILRDIFTMGARPIAIGDYLRFGSLENEKQLNLLEGVVAGIAHYGNCMGIPCVAGHVSSNPCYDQNILVNVFALGIADVKKIFKSSTGAPGQSVMIWGAKTGRDGIHGASLLASSDFKASGQDSEETSLEQKIRVQVGDPFKEKVLMEATLEIMEKFSEDLPAIQDMGAAGLTCSTMEISHKSQVGMKVNLNKVPVREEGMKAYELLLSESQERMLALVKKGSEEKIRKVLEKWGCEAEVIGETTDSGRLEMTFNGELVVDLPVAQIQDPPPAELPAPEWSLEIAAENPNVEDIRNEFEVLTHLLQHPSICSKENIYRRYDSTVGAASVLGPGHDAAVLWVGEKKSPHPFLGVAFKGAADEEIFALDAKLGAKAALVRGIRSLACTGAKAIAYTDGINLGNPHNPRVQAALQRMVEGCNEVARIFDTPCTGGNVSMYNQTQIETSEGLKKVDIFPTTFMVMVGTMEDVRKAVPSHFQKQGSEVWLLEIPGNQNLLNKVPSHSVYARLFWPADLARQGELPTIDLEAEKRLQAALLKASVAGLFLSARDVSQGGLAVSLAKASFNDANLGFDGDLSKTQARRDSLLFGEHAGRAIVEIDPARRAELMKLGLELNLQPRRLGSVEYDVFRMRPSLSTTIKDLKTAWTQRIQ